MEEIKPVPEIVHVEPIPAAGTDSGDFDFEGRFFDPKQLLSMAWGIYKSKFLKIMLAFLLPTLLMMAAISGMVFLAAPKSFSELSDPVFLAAAVGMIAIFVSVVGTWQGVALIYLIDGLKTNLGVREAYARAWKKIYAYWWLIFLEGIIVIGAFVPLIVPGIILSVAFTFSLFVMVLENTSGLAAMLRSREYVKGRWWAVVGRHMYPGLFILAAAIPLGIILAVISGGNKETMDSLEGIVNLVTLPLAPLFMIYYYLIYKNLKALHPEEPEPITGKGWWYLLAVWGTVSPLIITAALIITLMNPFIGQVTTQVVKNSGSPTNLLFRMDLISVHYAVKSYHSEFGVFPTTLTDPNLRIEDHVLERIREYGFRVQIDADGSEHACLKPPDMEETCYYKSPDSE